MKHLSENVIWSFLEGNLSDIEMELAEEHLAECDICCEAMANLAELGTDIPDLFPLEQPADGFADRVMQAIATETSAADTEELPNNVIPLRPRRKSPSYESFTRFVTAAAVTGFMIFGSVQFQTIPGVGSIGETVSQTGTAVSDGTFKAYSQLNQWIRSMNTKISE